MTLKTLTALSVFILVVAVLTGCGNSGSDQNEAKPDNKDTRPLYVPADFEKVHDAGLYVKQRTPGDGEKLQTGDVALIHFHGKRVDLDKTFQNTYEEGMAMSGEIGQKQFMPALNILLDGARIGNEFQAYIPPELGFGNLIVKKVPAGTPLYLHVQVIGKKEPKPPFDTAGIEPEKGVLDLEIYKVEKTDGRRPQKGDLVKLHYNAYFKDGGKKFNSSYDSHSPIVFNVLSGTVIQGMDAAARSLREGEKARVIIPYQYGYGKNGRQNIPGETDLVFDIHLFEVTPDDQ